MKEEEERGPASQVCKTIYVYEQYVFNFVQHHQWQNNWCETEAVIISYTASINNLLDKDILTFTNSTSGSFSSRKRLKLLNNLSRRWFGRNLDGCVEATEVSLFNGTSGLSG